MASTASEAPSAEENEDANSPQESSHSVLDGLLKKLTGTRSRDASPDTSMKGSRSGASKRKPKVTKKYVETDEDLYEHFATLSGLESENLSLDTSENAPGDGQVEEVEERIKIDIDEHGNYVLPEGTMVVQPEAVEEEQIEFKGPEFRPSKRTKGKVDLDVMHCTSCNKQINAGVAGNAKRHPVLKVLICKKCYTWYTSAEIEQDEDGMDEQCRWCGEGGNLICCDFCHNAFCKGCIKRNLGRTELSNILDAGNISVSDDDSKWRCYVCDPKPLAGLITDCDQTLKQINEYHSDKKDKDRRDRDKIHQKTHREKTVTVTHSQQKHSSQTSGVASRQVAVKSTGKGAVKQHGHIDLTTMKHRHQQKTVDPHQAMRMNQMQQHRDFHLNEFNVTLVLDRLLASQNSMSMLLRSLKEELSKANLSPAQTGQKIRLDVARKLKRAMLAFKKSFWDIEDFARNVKGPTHLQRQNLKNLKGKDDRFQLVTLKNGKMTLIPKPVQNKPKKIEEVVILDSSDEEEKVKEKKSVKVDSKGKGDKRNRSTSDSDSMVKDGKDHKDEVRQKTKIQKKDNCESDNEITIDDISDDKKEKSDHVITNGHDKELEVNGNSQDKSDHNGETKSSDEVEENKSVTEDENKSVTEDENKSVIDDENKSIAEDENKSLIEDENKSVTEDENKSVTEDEHMIEDVKSLAEDAKSLTENDNDSQDDVSVVKENTEESDCNEITNDLLDDISQDSLLSSTPSKKNISSIKRQSSFPDLDSDDCSMSVDGTNDDKLSNSDVGNDSEVNISRNSKSKKRLPPRRSRADIEAQRELHKELLDEETSDSQNSESEKASEKDASLEESDTESTDQESDTGSVYDPKVEFEDLKPAQTTSGRRGGRRGKPKKMGHRERYLEKLKEKLKGKGKNVKGKMAHKQSDSDSESEEEQKVRKKKQKEKKDSGDNGIGLKANGKSSRKVKREIEDKTGESSDEESVKLSSKKSKTSSKSKQKVTKMSTDSESDKTSRKSSKKVKRETEDKSDQTGESSDEEDVKSSSKKGKTSPKSKQKVTKMSTDSESDKTNGKSSKKVKKEIENKSDQTGESSDEENEKSSSTKKGKTSPKSKQKVTKMSTDSDSDTALLEERIKRDKKKFKSSSEKGKISPKSKQKDTKMSTDSDSDTALMEERIKKDKKKLESSSEKNKISPKSKQKDTKMSTDSDSDTALMEERIKKDKKKLESSSEKGKISPKSKQKDTKMSTDSDSDSALMEKRIKKDKKKLESSCKLSDITSDFDEDSIENKKKMKKSSKSKKASDEDDSEKETKSEKKKASSKSKKKTEKEEYESSSSNFDSELEKEIDNLAKMPKPKNNDKKSKPKEDKKDSSEDSDKEELGKTVRRRVKITPKKSRRDLINELVSDESDENQEDDADESKDMEVENKGSDEEESMNIAETQDHKNDSTDEDEKARKALLADDSTSDDSPDDEEEDEDESNSDPDKKTSSSKSNKIVIDSDNSGEVIKGKKKKQITSKLLSAKLSDSENDFEDSKKKKTKRKNIRNIDSSDTEKDSDGSSVKPKKKGGKKKKQSSSNSDSDSDGEKKRSYKQKGKKRRRIKMCSASSNSEEAEGDPETGDEDDDNAPGSAVKRKKIRKIIKDKKVGSETKAAARAEEERRKRIEERQKLFNQVVETVNEVPITTKLVLESDKDGNPVVEVLRKIIKRLKPHQVEAVKFLWNCCVESLDRLDKGSGCILAHCMGLGKTLTVISFVHTILTHKETKMRTCLVVCPLNTVLNWQSEWEKWFDADDQLDVYELSSVKDNWNRADTLEMWQQGGGILIIGYEMYRNLTLHKFVKNKRQKKIFSTTLVDPGPDLVVCDEGHILKNDGSSLSKAMNEVRTRKRIVLTGTPLQNNLIEYHCMVNFVKPNLIGTRKEFANRFVNPITNGQCADSTGADVKIMKRRAHILHETLAGCVQRKDYSALAEFLPPKHEYVLLIQMSDVQIELYKRYLEITREGMSLLGGGKGARLFKDYQYLMRIWTHPWVLKLSEIRDENKKPFDDEDSFLDDEESYDSDCNASTPSSKSDDSDEEVKVLSGSDNDFGPRKTRRQTRAQRTQDRNSRKESASDKDEIVKSWKSRSRGGEGDNDVIEEEEDTFVSSEWWAKYVAKDDRYRLELSGKLTLLAEILKLSESCDDKLLVFSQSLLSLDLIEDFLEAWDKSTAETLDKQIAGFQGWTLGQDYFRMDGSTSAQNRQHHTAIFNDPDNKRARLFLISTKAGSLGINMVQANRVIIFDASWNPSHDVQSIFRVYRFGQTKPCYIYRFLAQGTMEEKIYERQVTKQSLAKRVVDEHQIERHFNASDLAELYNLQCTNKEENKERVHKLPKDRLFAELLTTHKEWISGYHEHDSLLENKIEEELDEDERKAAWEEYENEKKGIRKAAAPQLNPMYAHLQQQQSYNYMQNVYPAASELAERIVAMNPTITQQQLQEQVQYYIRVQMANQQYMMQKAAIERRQAEEMQRLQSLTSERERGQSAYQSAASQLALMSSGSSSSRNLGLGTSSGSSSSSANKDDPKSKGEYLLNMLKSKK